MNTKNTFRWLAATLSILLLSIALPLSLTSCGGDDDDDDNAGVIDESKLNDKMEKDLQGLWYVYCRYSDEYNYIVVFDLTKKGKINVGYRYTKEVCEQLGLDKDTFYKGVSGNLKLIEQWRKDGYRHYAVSCDDYLIRDAYVVLCESDGKTTISFDDLTMIPHNETFAPIDLPFFNILKKVIGQWDGGSEGLDLTPIDGSYLWLSNITFHEKDGKYYKVAAGGNIHVNDVIMGAIKCIDENKKHDYGIVPVNDDKMQFSIDGKSPTTYNRMKNHVTIE